jgi:hypothetical protein
MKSWDNFDKNVKNMTIFVNLKKNYSKLINFRDNIKITISTYTIININKDTTLKLKGFDFLYANLFGICNKIL